MAAFRLVLLAFAAVIVPAARGESPAPFGGLQGGPTQPAADPASCKGVLSQPARVAGILSLVPKYGSTYVLVVPQRLAEQVPNPDAPGLKTIEVGVHGGTAGFDVARALGLTRVREYALDLGAPAQPLQDVKDQKLDAAIVWAPLAGLALIELELDDQVAVFAVDRPREAPAVLHAPAGPGAPGTPGTPGTPGIPGVPGITDPCAAAVADDLDADGVLPAELLVPVSIRTLLSRRAPAFSLAAAREGGPLFNQVCSKCHGPDAVADPHGLAPVDLRISTPRFTYPGFLYIILNGRPEKSMPPLRGTVTQDQIALIYQYLKARSQKLLPGGSS
jgi:mono/diheme cytochrome c family protein